MFDIDRYYQKDLPIEFKVKHDWKKKYLDYRIMRLPGPASIQLEREWLDFDFVDDKFIVLKNVHCSRMYLVSAIVSSVVFLWFVLLLFSLLSETPEDIDFFDFFYSTIVFMALIVTLILYYKAFFFKKDTQVIFDRLRGVVQVPGTFNHSAQLIRFDDLHVVMSSSQVRTQLFIRKNKHFVDRWCDSGIDLPFDDAYSTQAWSLLVWYMDKNRPLPFGTSFDAYRKRDYERRKSEGFPTPLYPSLITTYEYFTDEYDLMDDMNWEENGCWNKSLIDRHGKGAKMPDLDAWRKKMTEIEKRSNPLRTVLKFWAIVNNFTMYFADERFR